MGFFDSYIYDSPDGEDCLKKTFHTARTGAFLGAYLSLYDIIGRTHPKGAAAVTGRMLHYTLPAAAMGAVFASTACLVGEMRGKETAINHGIAGCAAGLVWGAKMNSIPLAATSCGFFAVFASFYKDGLLHGVNVLLKEEASGPMRRYHILGNHNTQRSEKLSPPENY